IPDENILPHRISFPFNYSPEVTPPGKSSILAEVTYRNGEIANMSDEKISAKVIEDLESLNILRREEIAVVHTARFKYAYVLHDLEYRDAITKIEKFFNSEGIFLFGRFSQWAYINMDQVMAQAYETAEKVVKKAVNQ
ncbi:MAG: FAD-dependent oxidoreductase, partial [Candidatus Korarchaeota archaeon]